MQKIFDNKSTGLAVIILQSEASENTVGRFVGIDHLTPEQVVLKTDHIVSRYPRDVTLHVYDFEEDSWQKVYQGKITDCVQADNPGNFLLSVTLEPPDHDRELFLGNLE